MRNERLLNIIGEIDDKYIEEAAPAQKRRTMWIKPAVIAASVAAALTAVVLPFFSGKNALLPNGGTSQPAVLGEFNVNERYKDIGGTSNADRLPWEWELETLYEKYWKFTFDGREYQILNESAVDESYIERQLGECTVYGKEIDYINGVFSEIGHSDKLLLSKIKGIDEELAAAAELDGERYVYCCKDEKILITLGEFFEKCDVPSLAKLAGFKNCIDNKDKEYYSLADDREIWEILSECKDAAYFDSAVIPENGKALKFYISSDVFEETGSLCVTEDGFFMIGVLNGGYYGCCYNIGKENAQRIINCAESNSKRATEKNYVIGKVKEIGEDYVLIDDTEFCKDPNDGAVFKVYTDKLTIKRELKGIKVGAYLWFYFKGNISTGNVIENPLSVNWVIYHDGEFWIVSC